MHCSKLGHRTTHIKSKKESVQHSLSFLSKIIASRERTRQGIRKQKVPLNHKYIVYSIYVPNSGIVYFFRHGSAVSKQSRPTNVY